MNIKITYENANTRMLSAFVENMARHIRDDLAPLEDKIDQEGAQIVLMAKTKGMFISVQASTELRNEITPLLKAYPLAP